MYSGVPTPVESLFFKALGGFDPLIVLLGPSPRFFQRSWRFPPFLRLCFFCDSYFSLPFTTLLAFPPPSFAVVLVPRTSALHKVGPIVLDSAVGAEVDKFLSTDGPAVFRGLVRRDTPGETMRVRVEVGREQVHNNHPG